MEQHREQWVFARYLRQPKPRRQSLHHNLIVKLADGPRSFWRRGRMPRALHSANEEKSGCHARGWRVSSLRPRRHVESQMGRCESSSFVSTPAAASVAIKVWNQPAPRQHLSSRHWRGSLHQAEPGSVAASRCHFFFWMNVVKNKTARLLSQIKNTQRHYTIFTLPIPGT